MNRFCALTLLLAVCSVTGNNYGDGYSNHRQQQQQPVVVNYNKQQSSSYNAPAQQSYSTSTSSSPSYSSNSYNQHRAPEVVNIAFSGGSSYSNNAPSYSSSSYEQPMKSSSYGSSNNAPATVSIGFSSNDNYGSNNNRNSYGSYSSYPSSSPSSYSSSSPSSYSSSNSYGSSNERNAAILRHNQNIQPGSSHQFDYSTSNGISHSEMTTVKQSYGGSGYGYNDGGSGTSITKTGQFSYTSPEGKDVSLSYSADENGFRAQGAHLPVPPQDPHHSSAYSQSSSGYHNSGTSYGYPAAPASPPASYSSY